MVSYKALNTVGEDTPFDSLQGVGEDNGRQGFATIEARTCYHLQGVRKGDGGQTGTSPEGTPFQRLDGVGKGNGGQSFASAEAISLNVHHGVRNVDGSQTGAIAEAIFFQTQ